MMNFGNIIGAVTFGIVAIGAAVGAIFYGATHQWAISRNYGNILHR